MLNMKTCFDVIGFDVIGIQIAVAVKLSGWMAPVSMKSRLADIRT